MTRVLMNKKEVAETLGIAPVSVDRLYRSGKLPFRRIGGLVRFTQADIEDFIQKSSVNLGAKKG